jgi:cell division septation protein DedD
MSDDGYYRGRDPYGRGGPPGGSQGHGQGHPDDDPLTELARLIGQDQFQQQQPDWRTAPPAVDYEGYQYPPAQAPDPRYADPGGYPNPDPYQAPGQQSHYDPQQPYGGQGYGDQNYADPHYQGGNYPQGGYDQPAYDQTAYGQAVPAYLAGDGHGAHDHDQGHEDDYEDTSSGSGRGGLFTVIAIVCLAVVGTAGAFAYRSVFSRPSTPPVILADTKPVKAAPAAPDNANRPDRGDAGQGERMISHEERPMNVQGATGGIPRVIMPMDSQSSQPSLPPNASALAPVSAPAAGPSEPKRVRTVIIKPGVPSGPDPAMQAPAGAPRVAINAATPVVARTVAPRPQVAPTAPADSQDDPPLSLSPEGAPPQQGPAHMKLSSTSTHAAASPAPTATASPAATAGGSFFVQLSAQKSEEDAQSTFRALQAKFSTQLSGRQLTIRRKDLDKGTFYGVQVGPFASREDAVQLCESLKSAGGACMLQKID